MKSYCKGKTIELEDVWLAYESWRIAPAGHKNLWRVYSEHGNADNLVHEIHREIKGRCLKFRPIRRYEAEENGKIRIIGVQSVKQQIVDYIVDTQCAELFRAKFGYYQVAGVKGKGASLAIKAIEKWVREPGYFAKADVYHCYKETDRRIVYDLFARYVKSLDILYCIRALLDTYDVGMELGSFFSMKAVLFMLSFPYHFVENLGKERRGKHKALVCHQIWQLDDVILFSRSKNDLKKAMRELERYMNETLGLRFKGWKVCRISEGEPVDLVGYNFRPSKTSIRSQTFLRGRRAMKRYYRKPGIKRARRVTSYMGYFKAADCEVVCMKLHASSVAAKAKGAISRYERS